jgi:hypothetical protein
VIALLLAGCADGGAAPGEATFTAVRDEILVPSCGFSSCHGTATGELLIDATGTWEALVDVPSAAAPGEVLVVPGDPDGSYLVKKLEGAPGIAGLRMPQGGQLDDADLELIREWIARGAADD